MRVEWKDIEQIKPPENSLVMVTGDSGYSRHGRFLTLAYYDEEYRPSIDGRIRWLTVCNDALSDTCWYPTHWSYPIILPEVA